MTRRRQRGDAEDRQIDLVGEAPSELIADEAGDQRTDRHAKEGVGNEIGIQELSREAGLQSRRQHVGADIEIIAVEKHAGADQPENAVVEGADRQPVKPSACIGGCPHVAFSPDSCRH
jgi:hypothetical protein